MKKSLVLMYSMLIAVQQGSAAESVLHTHKDIRSYAQEIALHPRTPDAFHIVDLGVLSSRYELWQKHLPEVNPCYAVKTNPDQRIVATMAQLGSCFDCASVGEISQVLSLGVRGDRIIFAHPRKSIKAILFARNAGVQDLVTDSREELDKILKFYPDARLVIRLRTDDSSSRSPLSEKFGATLSEARSMIKYLAEEYDISMLHGISFHVGSNNQDPKAYAAAISDAGKLFTYARQAYYYDIPMLDLGGGWVGEHDEIFAATAEAARKAIIEHIPLGVSVIAEPGRFFAQPTTLIAMKIIGKKHLKGANGEESRAYYLADGAYGSFLTALSYQYDRPALESEGFRFAPLFEHYEARPQYMSRLWGPTCDSYDRIMDLPFPDVPTSTWIYTSGAGAYSNATKTHFNGIEESKAFYINSRRHHRT